MTLDSFIIPRLWNAEHFISLKWLTSFKKSQFFPEQVKEKLKVQVIERPFAFEATMFFSFSKRARVPAKEILIKKTEEGELF